MIIIDLTDRVAIEELDISEIKTVNHLKRLISDNQKITYEQFKEILFSFSEEEQRKFEKFVSDGFQIRESIFKNFLIKVLTQDEIDGAWIFYQWLRLSFAEKFAQVVIQKHLDEDLGILKKEGLDTLLVHNFTQLYSCKKICEKYDDKNNPYPHSVDVMNRLHGLCHILCELGVIYNDYEKLIEKYNRNDISEIDAQNIELLATRKCILDIIGIIQQILLIFFKKFPETILTSIVQKQLVIEDNNKVKSINIDVLNNALNRMQDGQYLQLFFMKI
jgi:hypothetical protein